MFEQDVAGLIKALRANKNDESRVIQQALDECRKEIKNKDLEVKAAAILKLVYLEMLGHSISFAAFAIVECMSSTKYHIKSIGYLAASQCFDKETEVAVLVVNLVKKDLLNPPTPMFSSSPSSLTVAHLLSTLSAVSLLLTPSLARDLAPELLSMLTHSRPPIRKQTTLTMWRVVRAWQGVTELGTGREEAGEDPWIERLRERLADEDMGVVSATVNLICELARKNPEVYLPLAPELFRILTASTNNWMLIKIIKLFAVLTPIEPRLVRKLVPPLTELIETTPAMSLLFECIQTSIVGGMLNGVEGEALARTCVEKLKDFLEDVDQNLRYIALVALVKILPTHPHLVATHHETILSCIDDPDMSIRMRALDLVEGMVDRRTLQSIVQLLMTHLRSSTTTSTASVASRLQSLQNPDTTAAPPSPVILSTSYRISLISLILRMCSSSAYANVTHFEWYIDRLVELSYIAAQLSQEVPAGGATLGSKLRDQLVDVCARVKTIRPYAVKSMAALLSDDTFLENGEGADVGEVLGAAAWICGEYCRELEDPRPIIAALFGSPSSSLPPRILASYIHNGIKIYASWLSSLSHSWSEDSLEQVRNVTEALEEQLATWRGSSDLELQQRSAELGGLLEEVRMGLDAPRPIAPSHGFGSSSNDPYDDTNRFDEGPAARLPPSCLLLLAPLFFAHELNPVNPKAQSMVALPEGLNLDLVIVPRSAKSRREELEVDEEGAVDDFGRPIGGVVAGGSEEVKKERKGKKVGGVVRKKRREVGESPEELDRLKAERLERQREDPYYVGSTAAPPETSSDVDSIPIVQLSSLNISSAPRRAPTPPARIPTPPPVHIDVDGEMPDGVLQVVEPIKVIEEIKVEEEGEREAVEGTVRKVIKKKKKEGEKPKKKKVVVVVE